MDRFLEVYSTVAYLFAAATIVAAMYFHYRYTVGPSSTKNYHDALFYWFMSVIFAITAAVTDNTLSGTTTVVLTIAMMLALAVPVTFLRRMRRKRTPTFLDQIATDDIIDRAHTTRNQD
ncbi:hypothetical protein [Rhodococcoides yunnanense]|jgi:hypothetical protein|uniref:hypothetical protein n=1 Tax=Rhodococcoides yunnanense TaxID=278209 RepID=UPI0022B13933|nr:hypothetical protein [Rhodococcus yunnanensis]MCZ4277440.1 hypothetical protein [Rhodococcus yunnanensis]